MRLQIYALGLMASTLSLSLGLPGSSTSPFRAAFAAGEGIGKQSTDIVQASPDPSDTPRSLSINGALEAEDATLNSGEYYEIHTFEGTEGQSIQIDLVSEAFDTYLIVFGPDGDRLAENDDGDSSNAQVWLTLPTTGTYTVWATSYSVGEVGAYVLSWQEDTTLAELQQALAAASATGDRTAELEALSDIADLYFDRDEYAKALEHFQQLLDLAVEVGDTNYELYSYFATSTIYDSIALKKNRAASQRLLNSEWEPAIALAQEGLTAAEQSVQLARQGLSRAEAVASDAFIPQLTPAVPGALVTVAQSYQSMSQGQQGQARTLIAEQNYRQAESLEQESIATAEEALEAAQVALALMRDGQDVNPNHDLRLTAAVTAVVQGYDILGSTYYGVRALRLQNEGLFQAEIESLQQALAAYEASLPLARESNQLTREHDQLTELKTVENAQADMISIYQSLSTAYGELGQYAEGIAAAEQALALARQLPSRNSELTALGNLSHLYDDWGEAYLDAENYDQALAAQEESLVYAQAKLRVAESFSTSPSLSEWEFDYAARGIDIVQDARISVSNAYAGIRWIYRTQDDYESALAISRKLLAIDQQIENPIFEDSTLQALYVDYSRLSRYPEALAVTQQRLALARQHNNPARELSAIVTIASIQQDLGAYPEAIAAYEESLATAPAQGDIQTQITVLQNLGTLYGAQGAYENALANYKEALELNREVRSRLQQAEGAETLEATCLSSALIAQSFDFDLPPELSGLDERSDREVREQLRQRCIESSWHAEQKILGSIAANYSAQGRYAEALSLNAQALKIIQTYANDRAQEANATGAIGVTYGDMGEYPIALDYYNRALAIATDINYQPSIALSLTNLGQGYYLQGDYLKALESYQTALKIVQDTGLRPQEVGLLNRIGQVYYARGLYDQATEVLQQALSLSTQLEQKADRAYILSSLSGVAADQGQYDPALEYAQQSLAILQAIGARPAQADLLVLVGRIQNIQGNYGAAIAAQQQALDVATAIGDLDGEAYALQQLGITYSQMGQYDQALAFNQQALAIVQRIGDRHREATTLDAIGHIYSQQDNPEQALDFYAQALAIWQAIGSPVGEASSLRHEGLLRAQLGEYAAAKQTLQQALELQQQIGAQGYEGLTLNGLAMAHASDGEAETALSMLQRALILHQATGDRPNEAKVLSDIGHVLANQDQSALAIVFYKQSVNVYESIRGNIRTLDPDLQASYTDSIATTYRSLADLLLRQDRIVEAQRILDLLKVQELEEYRRGVQRTDDSTQGVVFLRPEETILARLGELQKSAIEAGQELATLQQIDASQLTAEQKARIAELDTLLTQVNADFREFSRDPEIRALIEDLSFEAREARINPGELDSLRDELRQLNAAIFYPLVLEDRLELVITTPDSPPLRRTLEEFEREELNQVILTFRQQLSDADPNIEATAQQLYDWLVRPLEDDLEQAGIDTIIYAPDGQLRYIPLAALHDGDNWLVQRYRVHNIIARSLADITETDLAEPQILAAAYADPGLIHTPEVNGQTYTFRGLPGAGAEVAALPATNRYLDLDFSLAAVKPEFYQYNILHFATHAAFVPGVPEDSFILFGNGDTPTLRDVESWTLNNIDLVVLSACETGVGGLGNGEEILGLGYQFQLSGAKSVMASLWTVSDRGTQVLMTAFYDALAQGMTKAEALQTAQQAMITNPQDPLSALNRTAPRPTPREGVTLPAAAGYDHPYYWAPFILIGNGL